MSRNDVTKRSRRGAAATEVILLTFRANGMLITAGDALAGEEGLTSARWQVLGALVLAGSPLTVPQVARRMGLTRQSVHATVDRLEADGMVELAPNDDHRRSRLIRLTEHGMARYSAIDARQVAWSNRLVVGMKLADLETTTQTLRELCERLKPD